MKHLYVAGEVPIVRFTDASMMFADGPDEVHCRAIARLKMRKYTNTRV